LSYKKKAPSDPERIQREIRKARQKGLLVGDHTKRRMLERGITQKEIELIIEYGIVVEEQEHGNPPRIRYQVLGPQQVPYVAVVAITKGGRLVVITVFEKKGED